ncbi:MAG: hypothetical protein VB835_16435, partial [Pirellulales bacterium]
MARATPALGREGSATQPLERGDVDPADNSLGAQLFGRKCARCHSHADEAGGGIVSSKPTAPNLHEFASRKWITGLLNPTK